MSAGAPSQPNLLLLAFVGTILTPVEALLGGQLDEETYAFLIDDAKTQIDTVYTSSSGIAINRITAFISAASSLLILYIIVFSSPTKLGTPYHRIMFGIGVSGFFTSLTLFASTWAMPKDMIYQQFQSAVHGSELTCTMQGSIYFSMSFMFFAFFVHLCIYYLCIIRYNFTEEKFRKKVEYLLTSLSITIPIVMGAVLAQRGVFAPSPIRSTCAITDYPYWCNSLLIDKNNTDHSRICTQRESPDDALAIGMKYLYLVITLCGGLLIGASMVLVWWTSYTNQRNIVGYIQSTSRVQTRRRPDATTRRIANYTNQMIACQTETSRLFAQAITYFAGFALSSIFFYIRVLAPKLFMKPSSILAYMHLSMRISRFFVMLIFVWHKMSNEQRCDETLTNWQAFWKVLKYSQDEPLIFMGNMDIVRNQQNGVDIGSTDDDDAESNAASTAGANAEQSRESRHNPPSSLGHFSSGFLSYNDSILQHEKTQSSLGLSYDVGSNNELNLNYDVASDGNDDVAVNGNGNEATMTREYFDDEEPSASSQRNQSSDKAESTSSLNGAISWFSRNSNTNSSK